MYFKKGQSALEFLTTYGWAFLVALIMIGALAYFGVLNPSKYLPERCSFGSQIGCTDYIVDSAANTVTLRLTNNLGEAVYVTSCAVGTNTPQQPTCAAPAICSGAPLWQDGQAVDFAFTGCGLVAAGAVANSKSKFNVSITYYAAKSSAAYTHLINGEVYAQVR